LPRFSGGDAVVVEGLIRRFGRQPGRPTVAAYVVPDWVVSAVMRRSGMPGGRGLSGWYGHGGHDGVLVRWDSPCRWGLRLPGMLPILGPAGRAADDLADRGLAAQATTSCPVPGCRFQLDELAGNAERTL